MKDWFKKLGIKFKIALGAIAAVFSFVLLIALKQKISNKQILKNELKRLRQDIEIEKIDGKIKENNEKLETLEAQEVVIRDKIEEIETTSREKDLSDEDLQKFFNDRGF